MNPPKDTKIIDWYTSIIWFDEDGILYSSPKPGVDPLVQTKEKFLEQMDKFRKLLGGKKACMILEPNRTSPPPKKEEREWLARELNSITRAMAIISSSPLSRMVANLFFGLTPPAYPFKFFSNETDAKKWIKQYL